MTDANERCGYGKAWVGPCASAKPCKEHANRSCVSCGRPATHECDETFQFVCGVDLCDECEHQTDPDGTNGGLSQHCRKADQKFKPWYVQTDAEQAEGSRLQAELNAERRREFEDFKNRIATGGAK